MKKILTICVCALSLLVALNIDAAPKKKVVKKKAKTTTVSQPAVAAPVSTKSIDELISAAVGKEGAYRQINQLVANKDFVNRAQIDHLVANMNGLAGSAYQFNHNGVKFYLLKFSNYLVDASIEDVILYVPSQDNIIRCRCKNSENMEILGQEKDFEVTAAEVQKFYDSTFNMQGN